jgi:hypothetical protein
MLLCDDVFFYQVLPYADFPTLYLYRHHPSTRELYQRRLSTVDEITDKLLVALTHDDQVLYSTSVMQADSIYVLGDLIHLTLNEITSSFLRPKRIFGWLLDNVQKLSSARFAQRRIDICWHLAFNLPLAQLSVGTIFQPRYLSLLRFQIPSEDHRIFTLKQLLQFFDEPITVPQTERPPSFSNLFEFVSRSLALRILDPTTERSSIDPAERSDTTTERSDPTGDHTVIPTSTLEEIYNRMRRLVPRFFEYVICRIPDIVIHPEQQGESRGTLTESDRETVAIWGHRLFGIQEYRRTREMFLDPNSYDLIATSLDKWTSVQDLEDYLSFVEYHIADPESFLDILYEHDCHRDVGYDPIWDETTTAYLTTISEHLGLLNDSGDSCFSPKLSVRLARHLTVIYDRTPHRLYASCVLPDGTARVKELFHF